MTKLLFMIVALREKIIESTIELFSKKGYDDVSITDIAKKCKVATSTLYYHFRDKHDLLSQVFLDVLTKMANHFREGIDYSKPFEEQYKMALYTAIKYLHKNKHRCNFYTIFTLAPNSPISVAERRSYEEICPIGQLLKKGMETGVLQKRAFSEAMTLGYIPVHNYSVRNNSNKYIPAEGEINNFIASLWKALLPQNTPA